MTAQQLDRGAHRGAGRLKPVPLAQRAPAAATARRSHEPLEREPTCALHGAISSAPLATAGHDRGSSLSPCRSYGTCAPTRAGARPSTSPSTPASTAPARSRTPGKRTWDVGTPATRTPLARRPPTMRRSKLAGMGWPVRQLPSSNATTADDQGLERRTPGPTSLAGPSILARPDRMGQLPDGPLLTWVISAEQTRVKSRER